MSFVRTCTFVIFYVYTYGYLHTQAGTTTGGRKGRGMEENRKTVFRQERTIMSGEESRMKDRLIGV